jgi:hypothetical protein
MTNIRISWRAGSVPLAAFLHHWQILKANNSSKDVWCHISLSHISDLL